MGLGCGIPVIRIDRPPRLVTVAVIAVVLEIATMFPCLIAIDRLNRTDGTWLFRRLFPGCTAWSCWFRLAC